MRSQGARIKLSATEARNMRRLLLLNVFEPEEIGDRIKQARERAGLRQEDLADLIGMSTRQVQNYEAGESKQYAKLRAIANATGSTVEWLLGTATDRDGDGDPGTTARQLVDLRESLDRIEQMLRERLDEPPAGTRSA
jgi:transcriptional regulator with XRE-family HTH domain